MPAGQRVRCRQAAESRPAARFRAASLAGIRPGCGSTMITGRCRPGRPDAHQGTATDGRMLVEDRLATDRIHRPGGRQHAMGHPAAEPEPPLRVEIARVAHPMPDLARRRRSSPGRSHSVRVTYSPRDHRPANDQFADLARRQFLDRRPAMRIGPSTMRITFHWMPGNGGRRTRRPPAARLRPAVSPSTSLAAIEATGRASVAP